MGTSRRFTKIEYKENPGLRKDKVTCVRFGKETEHIIASLMVEYGDLYYNKSHLIECAIRRLKSLHDKKTIKAWYYD